MVFDVCIDHQGNIYRFLASRCANLNNNNNNPVKICFIVARNSGKVRNYGMKVHLKKLQRSRQILSQKIIGSETGVNYHGGESLRDNIACKIK